MTRVVCPGSFDPITNGQLDIIQRAAKLFREVIVGVHLRPATNTLFTLEERMQMVQEVLSHIPSVTVTSYDGLTVDFARSQGATAILRSLRVISDFEHEFQMALMSRKLAPEIDFVCLMTSIEHTYLSSGIIKEVAMFGGDISEFVPPPVEVALRRRIESLGDQRTQKVDLISLKNG